MTTEVKRVPLDFNWPIDEVWKGYLNPYLSRKCNFCDGTGYNPATKQIDDTWNSWSYQLTDIETNALLEENRLLMLTHIPVPGGWEEKKPIYIPTPEEVNNWYRAFPPGHDEINRQICVEERAKHLGIYGICEHCSDGQVWESEEMKKLHDAWKPVDPPLGSGYQLWSTTTEGHPVTPVFTSIDQLNEYCEKENI